MGSFPVPRHELPAVHVSAAEHRARKAQMQRMLDALVDDYERFTEGGSRQVDMRRWKPSTSRGKLKLFKERSESNVYAATTYYSESDSEAAQQRERAAGSMDSTMTFSEEKADAMRMTLMVGECPGRMENAMYATIAPTQAQLSMVDIFLHEDVADCAILNMMESPTAEDPYFFLGYKWFVRKSPTNASLVNHRDTVYVEYSGVTTTRAGKELGYHIMHSVDLVDFPEMTHRNCVRISQSIRALYHQKPGNIVEVFIMGNVDIGGMVKGPIANVFIQETLFNMPKLIDCGEAKRLTKMLRDSRALRDQRAESKRHSGEVCTLCRQQKKLFSSAITECDVCGQDACSKCRLSKRVYQHEGILGRFYKVTCCKTCVLATKTPKPFESTRVPEVPVTKVSTSASASSTSKSVRSLAESLERRHRAGSNSVSADSTDSSFFGASPANPPSNQSTPQKSVGSAHGSTPPPPVPMHVGSAASSQDSALSAASHGSSSYFTPVASPLIEITPLNQPSPSTRMPPPPPPLTGSLPQAQADMYRKIQELQQKAQAAYIMTRQNQRYLDGQIGS